MRRCYVNKMIPGMWSAVLIGRHILFIGHSFHFRIEHINSNQFKPIQIIKSIQAIRARHGEVSGSKLTSIANIFS